MASKPIRAVRPQPRVAPRASIPVGQSSDVFVPVYTGPDCIGCIQLQKVLTCLERNERFPFYVTEPSTNHDPVRGYLSLSSNKVINIWGNWEVPIVQIELGINYLSTASKVEILTAISHHLPYGAPNINIHL